MGMTELREHGEGSEPKHGTFRHKIKVMKMILGDMCEELDRMEERGYDYKEYEHRERKEYY